MIKLTMAMDTDLVDIVSSENFRPDYNKDG